MSHRIWKGRVWHRRFAPVPHAFHYRLFLVGLDLDHLESGFRGRWFWSSRGPAPFWIRRRDHFGDPSRPWAQVVRETVALELGFTPQGRIELLTQPRTLGYVMNPVSFFHCFDGEGRLAAVIAEIHNTPWGERHLEILDQRNGRLRSEGVTSDFRERTLPASHRFRKRFHVSPFLPMDLSYAWAFERTQRTTDVHMENWREGERLFEARLHLDKQRFSAGTAARACLGHPLQTFRIVLAIYWHALLLWLKGAPFHDHPKNYSSSSRTPA